MRGATGVLEGGRHHMLQSGDGIGFVYKREKSRECDGAPEGRGGGEGREGGRREGGRKTLPPSFPHHLQQGKVLKKHLWFEQ